MSTYNGERYLKEQLDSLYAQKGVDFHILVRDDGSQDSTISLLYDYQQQRGMITKLQEKNIGAAYSFYELIHFATEEMPEFDYYAFSDQDDVWFEDKLLSSINLMEGSKEKYRMAYCDQQPTDANLQPIDLFQEHDRGSIGANIVSNHIAGCVQMYNRQLFLKLNAINSTMAKKRIGQTDVFS